MEKGTKREGKERGACEEKRERREWEKGRCREKIEEETKEASGERGAGRQGEEKGVGELVKEGEGGGREGSLSKRKKSSDFQVSLSQVGLASLGGSEPGGTGNLHPLTFTRTYAHTLLLSIYVYLSIY